MYLGLILGIEMVALYLIEIMESSTTQFLYPFYIAGEFYIVVNLFLKELKVTKKWQIIVGLIASCFFIEASVLWFISNDASTGYGKIMSHLTIICLAAILLIKNLNELKNNNILTIIHAAFFLYYSVSLFLFMIMNQLTEYNSFIWIINNVLASLLYICFIFTFFRISKWSSKPNI
ncbi:hypothetical protein EI427_19450 [Flammeovirga pectinis]|uniref:Uncharacterized protein n=1 Tax=Flammeovirga pectinis TaxID=2494373 RepID=A0A3S9P7Z8_9BACT|nr:hypothetical protein [Flammeovirga pectinis]AZQ64307.1 hypothetical protein EI427_19450 [Flammeovirga pectinis]